MKKKALNEEETLQNQLWGTDDDPAIDENEQIKKIKREDIVDYLSKLGYDHVILNELNSYLTKEFLIERTKVMKLPNVVIVRRGKLPGFDAYYTNNFRYIIHANKSWDKDILLITN